MNTQIVILIIQIAIVALQAILAYLQNRMVRAISRGIDELERLAGPESKPNSQT